MWNFKSIHFFAFLLLHLTLVKSTAIVLWSELGGKGYSVNLTDRTDNQHCVQVSLGKFKPNSITTDKCVLFYTTHNCSGDLVFKVQEGTKNTTTFYFLNDEFGIIQSWILCNFEQENFNVKIYNDSDTSVTPVIQFENICNCVNIPEEFHNRNIFLYAEGEQILMYENLNCTGAYEVTYGGEVPTIWLKRLTSIQPFDRPLHCPVLHGVVADVTNFKQTKAPYVALVPIANSRKKITTPVEQEIRITLDVEDVRTITLEELEWTRRLEACRIKNGLTLKNNLWETSFENKNRFMDEIIATHCKPSNAVQRLSSKRTFKSNESFVFTKNISVSAGTSALFTAQRGYVIALFEYSIQFNISGKREQTNARVSAEDLEKSFPQSGLKFMKKLDDYTILAEITALLESQYPVSTVYNIL